MADIRIKDLAVTASSSASDDYLAVDGSTNGTRKLSAYSPTFGGNLTVSGASYNNFTGALWLGTTAGYGTLNVGNVSGTGTATYSCLTIGDQNTPANATGLYMRGTTAVCGISTAGAPIAFFTGGPGTSEAARFFNNGNFGIGTGSTDGGQKLQVNGTAYVSGDATFAGTVTAVGISTFKRSDNTGSIRVVPTSGVSAGSDLESFNLSTLAYGRLNARSTHLQVYTGTNATTLALTVDDSQNATFAGTIKPQQAATASAPTYVKGAIYFDTTLNKLRVGGAIGWETITSV